MTIKYSFQNFNKDNMAKLLSKDLSISTKFTIETCNLLRNKDTKKAKKILDNIVNMKQAVPLLRFNKDVAHKPGIASGRYPVNIAKTLLKLINNVEANAQFKGLNTNNLQIIHIAAHKASEPFHFGRHRRRKMKRTHVEIVVKESNKDKK